MEEQQVGQKIDLNPLIDKLLLAISNVNWDNYNDKDKLAKIGIIVQGITDFKVYTKENMKISMYLLDEFKVLINPKEYVQHLKSKKSTNIGIIKPYLKRNLERGKYINFTEAITLFEELLEIISQEDVKSEVPLRTKLQIKISKLGFKDNAKIISFTDDGFNPIDDNLLNFLVEGFKIREDYDNLFTSIDNINIIKFLIFKIMPDIKNIIAKLYNISSVENKSDFLINFLDNKITNIMIFFIKADDNLDFEIIHKKVVINYFMIIEKHYNISLHNE